MLTPLLPLYHKSKTFPLLIIGCGQIRSFKKMFSQDLHPLGVKGILLPLLRVINSVIYKDMQSSLANNYYNHVQFMV